MRIKFILPAMIAMSFAFTGCNKDKEEEEDTAPAELTKEEGESAISGLSINAKQDFIDMQESEGGEALDNLTGLLGNNDGDSPLGRGYQGKKGKAFRGILSGFKSSIKSTQGKTAEDEDWDFEANKGTYTYNNATDDFDLTDGTTDAIVIIFPADEDDLGTNNATLTVSDYTEDAEGQPTRLKGDLKVDGDLVTSIDYTGAFDGEGEPTSLDVTFVLVPFEMKGSLSKDSDTKLSGSSSLTKSGTTIYDVAGNVEFKTSELEDLVALSGHVQYGDVRVTGSIDGERIEELDAQDTDPTSAEINSAFDATITRQSTGAKIGTLVAADYTDEDQDTYPNLFVEYNDGSQELAEGILEDLIAEIETFVEELEEDLEEEEVAVRN